MDLSDLEVVWCISAQSGSDLDIHCAFELPPNRPTTVFDQMKADCSALLWTAPTGRTSSSLPTPTSRQTQLSSTTPTVTAGLLQSTPSTALSSSRPVLTLASSEGQTRTSPVPASSGINVQGVCVYTCRKYKNLIMKNLLSKSVDVSPCKATNRRPRQHQDWR